MLVLSAAVASKASAWSNGGYSSDPSNPDYGTHDWIAQHALDWLPEAEKQYITDNLAAYLYGTELPDNAGVADGIGDKPNHHIYYSSSGVMTDNASAVRASEVYGEALTYLVASDLVNAAKHAGIMTHYIADMAVFGHVMGSGTDWGAEPQQRHEDYETYVNQRTSSYDAEFNSYLSYDGSLVTISAYDAAKDLAYDTTFDVDGDLTCVWMDQHYNWNDPTFRDRCGESLNLAVNYVADVLHSLYVEATPGPRAQSSITCSASPSTITLGSSVTVSGSISPSHAGVAVSLTYTKPDATTIARTATTTSAGSYSDVYTPDMAGSWTVIASWDGDSDHLGATSSHAHLTVEGGGGCIIATATYGSELAPKVQFLRGFRDSIVLSTFAGSQFMRVFNAWYYSFSPSVAGFIARQPVAKTIMRGVLYPLIGILHLSSMTYSAFSFSPEIGVVVSGFVASSLIGVVYFTLPAMVLLAIIKRLKKKTLKTMRFKLLAIPWLISLVLVLLGEIALSPAIMMAATASFVLTTLASSATIVASKITQRLP